MSICFVAMPFRKRKDASGREIDFDAIYKDVIAPAIAAAGLKPYRADEELSGGFVHIPMYQMLLLCDYAIVDLTTANPNVLYELGARHAFRPRTTVLMYGSGPKLALPFDVAPLRAVQYTTKKGHAADSKGLRNALTKHLKEAIKDAQKLQKPPIDSPLFQSLKNYPDIEHDRAEVFKTAEALTSLGERLDEARGSVRNLKKFESSLGELAGIDQAILLRLLLAYRDQEEWKAMIELESKMPRPLAATVTVREQLALALNRDGRGAEAETILRNIIKEYGPNAETCGILGRVYKDRWQKTTGSPAKKRAELDKAIDAYLQGFQADPRDAYPGINAVTLLAAKGERRRIAEILPVVRFAVKRKIAMTDPDYWDYATLLELAVHADDDRGAEEALGQALAKAPSKMMLRTTIKNLKVLAETNPLPWLAGTIRELEKATRSAT